MSFNIVILTNDGITSAFSKMDFALLKARPLADDNGEVRAYRATLVITTDRSTYTRSNGERVEGANTGEVFQVTINRNQSHGYGNQARETTSPCCLRHLVSRFNFCNYQCIN